MPNIQTSYSIKLANKADKKAILRFYKNAHYSARFIGHDLCFVVEYEQQIIACVIISGGEQQDNHYLLHALVTDKAYQGRGFATQLISFAIQHLKTNSNNDLQIFCFADSTLQVFYQKSAFQLLTIPQREQTLPLRFFNRFQRYQQQTTNLQCFIKQLN